jgi:hypothetical protein
MRTKNHAWIFPILFGIFYFGVGYWIGDSFSLFTLYQYRILDFHENIIGYVLNNFVWDGVGNLFVFSVMLVTFFLFTSFVPTAVRVPRYWSVIVISIVSAIAGSIVVSPMLHGIFSSMTVVSGWSIETVYLSVGYGQSGVAAGFTGAVLVFGIYAGWKVRDISSLSDRVALVSLVFLSLVLASAFYVGGYQSGTIIDHGTSMLISMLLTIGYIFVRERDLSLVNPFEVKSGTVMIRKAS